MARAARLDSRFDTAVFAGCVLLAIFAHGLPDRMREPIAATMRRLRDRGVVFEEFDLPGLTTVEGVAEVEGNYPSKGGVGERGAWFRDSEGNLLAIGQPVRP